MIDDIFSNKRTPKGSRIQYGARGEKVEIVSISDKMAIVRNIQNGQRFPVLISQLHPLNNP